MSLRLIGTVVTDTGFPRRLAPTPKYGTKTFFVKIYCRKLLDEIGPVDASVAPPGSANEQTKERTVASNRRCNGAGQSCLKEEKPDNLSEGTSLVTEATRRTKQKVRISEEPHGQFAMM